jgi:hypothetical protein
MDRDESWSTRAQFGGRPHVEGPSSSRHYGRRPNQRQLEGHSGALVAAVIFVLVLACIVIICSNLS